MYDGVVEEGRRFADPPGIFPKWQQRQINRRLQLWRHSSQGADLPIRFIFLYIRAVQAKRCSSKHSPDASSGDVMALESRGNPRRSLWPRIRTCVGQNFVDQWNLIAFGALGGFAVLLVSVSDAGRPSIARTLSCLLAPALATSLLIAIDGLANAFAKVSPTLSRTSSPNGP